MVVVVVMMIIVGNYYAGEIKYSYYSHISRYRI